METAFTTFPFLFVTQSERAMEDTHPFWKHLQELKDGPAPPKVDAEPLPLREELVRRVLFLRLPRLGLTYWNYTLPSGDDIEEDDDEGVPGIVEDFLKRFCWVEDAAVVKTAVEFVKQERLSLDLLPYLPRKNLKADMKLSIGQVLRFERESLRFVLQHRLNLLSDFELADILALETKALEKKEQ